MLHQVWELTIEQACSPCLRVIWWVFNCSYFRLSAGSEQDNQIETHDETCGVTPPDSRQRPMSSAPPIINKTLVSSAKPSQPGRSFYPFRERHAHCIKRVKK